MLVEPLDCKALWPHNPCTQPHHHFKSRLPARHHAHHKGSFGSVLVAGGAPGMVGAAILAARTAVLTGAGRVAVAPLQAFAPDWFDPHFPELMHKPLHQGLAFASVLAVGTGLGTCAQAQAVLAECLQHATECFPKNTAGNSSTNTRIQPMVLDADALNLIATHPHLRQKLAACPAPVVLTPHPLEAARLTGLTTQRVREQRIAVATDLANEFNAVVVLKGAGTVVTNGHTTLINHTGGPALATAGSGDVLTGAIASFLAQGLDALNAAGVAVWLHGYCISAQSQPILVSHASELAQRMKRELEVCRG
ncbi:MAG: NAD(P)H-hydrate dehydratase [Limnobacter sp.]|nr:NAD(P)H-hydrate dehydratase [Limnobacter sp.]